MINDIFSQVEQNVGKSLYADDGSKVEKYHVNKKILAPVVEIEKWTNKWGFK